MNQADYAKFIALYDNVSQKTEEERFYLTFVLEFFILYSIKIGGFIMKVKARWGKIGRNPFNIRADKNAIATKAVDFPDGTPIEEIEKLARENVPLKDYEFIDVKELK